MIGIDWADAVHAVCTTGPDGSSQIESLPHSPEAIDEWAAALQRRFPGCTLAVAVEQRKGALIHALMKYQAFRLYPINPKQLARYRDALHPSGGKDDPVDAALLAQFLKHHATQLRVFQPDDEATRKLGWLVEIRRKIVEERKRVTQQMLCALKQYFPLAATLFTKRPDRMAALLKRWPTLRQLQRAHPNALRAFLKQHGFSDADRQTQFIQGVRAAVPLTSDSAIVDSHALYVQSLAGRLLDLRATIERFDEQIAALVASHADEPIFRSLPGAGDALVPRLIVAFGTDRNRYESAVQLQNHSGIAPVTRQSGKQKRVSRRFACPAFLKQTFHEFADHARKWSRWSAAFYAHKRAAGFKHHAAVRALAYKWIRIIYRLWQTRTTYSEDHHIQQLQRRQSPLLKFLEPA